MNSLGNYLDNAVNYRACSGIGAGQHTAGHFFPFKTERKLTLWNKNLQ